MSRKFETIVSEVLEANVNGLKMSEEKMQQTLTDLGVDSLDVMLVLMEIQEKTGVMIPEDQADILQTPAQIAEFLKANG